MKRILPVLLCAVLVVCLLPVHAFASELPQMAAATDLEWGKNHGVNVWDGSAPVKQTLDAPGAISWKNTTGATVEIKVYNVKDESKPVFEVQDYYSKEHEGWRTNMFFCAENPESGSYYFTVTVLGDGKSYSNSETVRSQNWTYVKPADKVGKCSELEWTSDFKCKFTAPADKSLVGGYEVEVFVAENAEQEPQWTGENLSYETINYDFNGCMSAFPAEFVREDCFYYFRVRALSADLTKAGNGDWTELSPVWNHAEEVIPEKAPSCTATGLTEGVKCADCGVTIVAQKEIPMIAHKENVIQGKAATCTETGLTEGKQCSVCGTLTVKQEDIPATGHTYDNDEDANCNVCGEERQITLIYILYHAGLKEYFYTGSYDECQALVGIGWEFVDQTVAKTTKFRVYDPDTGKHYYTESEKKRDEWVEMGLTYEGVLPMPACEGEHTYVTIAGKDATCTTDGVTEEKTCSACGEGFSVPVKIAASGIHSYENGKCKVCGITALPVADQLNGLENKDASAEEIRDTIQNMDDEALKEALENDPEVVEKIEKLEQSAGGAAEVVANKAPAEMTAENVNIVGANLNDVAEGKTAILVIGEAQEQNTVPADYDASTAVHFSMTLENVENTKELATPVRITLPIPAGLDPDRVMVLHYHDGKMDVLKPAIHQEGGKYYASIVLDGFSDFAMVQSTEPEQIKTTPMYRLYNPNSGEHFYTANAAERDMLVGYGWADEGIAWYAPTEVGDPVYRLYNPNAGEHHYTTSAGERDVLVSYGWNDEGIGWRTAGNDQEPVYRVYNPNEFANNHHYTRDANERDWLVGLGWVDEGIGWYGVRK